MEVCQRGCYQLLLIFGLSYPFSMRNMAILPFLSFYFCRFCPLFESLFTLLLAFGFLLIYGFPVTKSYSQFLSANSPPHLFFHDFIIQFCSFHDLRMWIVSCPLRVPHPLVFALPFGIITLTGSSELSVRRIAFVEGSVSYLCSSISLGTFEVLWSFVYFLLMLSLQQWQQNVGEQLMIVHLGLLCCFTWIYFGISHPSFHS